MTPTHVGFAKSGRGARAHLSNASGRAECGRQVNNLAGLDECPSDFDSRWCQRCLDVLMTETVREFNDLLIATSPLDSEPLWEYGGNNAVWYRADEPYRTLGDAMCRGSINPCSYRYGARIRTIGGLRRAIVDGTLTQVHGVGPKIAEAIARAFETFLREAAELQHGPREDERQEIAGREAWALVADGYTAALNVPGLCDEDRACLLRQLRSADALAGRSGDAA